jgi:hypothetical protein
VAALVNERKAPGTYDVSYSAKGGSPPVSSGAYCREGAYGGDGSGLASGVYICRTTARTNTQWRKLCSSSNDLVTSEPGTLPHLRCPLPHTLLSLNRVFPLTIHETPNANSATDSRINTGLTAEKDVSRQKSVWRAMHDVARIMTIPQER